MKVFVFLLFSLLLLEKRDLSLAQEVSSNTLQEARSCFENSIQIQTRKLESAAQRLASLQLVAAAQRCANNDLNCRGTITRLRNEVHQLLLISRNAANLTDEGRVELERAARSKIEQLADVLLGMIRFNSSTFEDINLDEDCVNCGSQLRGMPSAQDTDSGFMFPSTRMRGLVYYIRSDLSDARAQNPRRCLRPIIELREQQEQREAQQVEEEERRVQAERESTQAQARRVQDAAQQRREQIVLTRRRANHVERLARRREEIAVARVESEQQASDPLAEIREELEELANRANENSNEDETTEVTETDITAVGPVSVEQEIPEGVSDSIIGENLLSILIGEDFQPEDNLIRPRTRLELIALAQQTLQRRNASSGLIPDDLDIVHFTADTEAQPIMNGDNWNARTYDRNIRNWQEHNREYAEAANIDPSQGVMGLVLRAQELLSRLRDDYMTYVNPNGDGSILETLNGDGVGTQQQALLVLEAFSSILDDIPAPLRVGLQEYSTGRYRPVLYNTSSHQVIDIQSNQTYSSVLRPIYTPDVVLYDYLERERANGTQISYTAERSTFLIVNAARPTQVAQESEIPAATPAEETSGETQNGRPFCTLPAGVEAQEISDDDIILLFRWRQRNANGQIISCRLDLTRDERLRMLHYREGELITDQDKRFARLRCMAYADEARKNQCLENIRSQKRRIRRHNRSVRRQARQERRRERRAERRERREERHLKIRNFFRGLFNLGEILRSAGGLNLRELIALARESGGSLADFDLSEIEDLEDQIEQLDLDEVRALIESGEISSLLQNMQEEGLDLDDLPDNVSMELINHYANQFGTTDPDDIDLSLILAGGQTTYSPEASSIIQENFDLEREELVALASLPNDRQRMEYLLQQREQQMRDYIRNHPEDFANRYPLETEDFETPARTPDTISSIRIASDHCRRDSGVLMLSTSAAVEANLTGDPWRFEEYNREGLLADNYLEGYSGLAYRSERRERETSRGALLQVNDILDEYERRCFEENVVTNRDVDYLFSWADRFTNSPLDVIAFYNSLTVEGRRQFHERVLEQIFLLSRVRSTRRSLGLSAEDISRFRRGLENFYATITDSTLVAIAPRRGFYQAPRLESQEQEEVQDINRQREQRQGSSIPERRVEVETPNLSLTGSILVRIEPNDIVETGSGNAASGLGANDQNRRAQRGQEGQLRQVSQERQREVVILGDMIERNGIRLYPEAYLDLLRFSARNGIPESNNAREFYYRIGEDTVRAEIQENLLEQGQSVENYTSSITTRSSDLELWINSLPLAQGASPAEGYIRDVCAENRQIPLHYASSDLWNQILRSNNRSQYDGISREVRCRQLQDTSLPFDNFCGLHPLSPEVIAWGRSAGLDVRAEFLRSYGCMSYR